VIFFTENTTNNSTVAYTTGTKTTMT